MAELLYEEDADLALRTLEADPAQGRLLAAVNAALDALEADPLPMTERLYQGRIRRIDVGFDWMILWEFRGADVVVLYVGPAL